MAIISGADMFIAVPNSVAYSTADLSGARVGQTLSRRSGTGPWMGQTVGVWGLDSGA